MLLTYSTSGFTINEAGVIQLVRDACAKGALDSLKIAENYNSKATLEKIYILDDKKFHAELKNIYNQTYAKMKTVKTDAELKAFSKGLTDLVADKISQRPDKTIEKCTELVMATLKIASACESKKSEPNVYKLCIAPIKEKREGFIGLFISRLKNK